MNTGNFYFIKDEYYKRFSNCGLMENKDTDEEGEHGRPCFYCFEDDGCLWMVPISSKIEKYTALYEQKKKTINEQIRKIAQSYPTKAKTSLNGICLAPH